MKVKNPRDFGAGVMFISLGLFFLLVAQKYRMGTATNMGPAYFPTLLGGLMAVIGSAIFFRSFVIAGEKITTVFFRPIFFITLSLLLFGYLLKPLGVIIALAFLLFGSAFAGHEFKFREVLILSIVLILFSIFVFVKGLGLPFPLWPKFGG